MLPIARANLDNICCICLVDVQPSVFKQRVYDVKKEKNLSKLLKVTAHITVLKNPLNLRHTNEYCRKVCEVCFLKVQYSYNFREKIIASAVTLKELLENETISAEEDIKKLQHFCRICLNRQNDARASSNCQINNKYLKLIKDCSGIRFSTLQETQTFRIKEGTNISELVTIHDELFPKQFCQNCLKKLRNVDEFRAMATQTFEYMISVMGDDTDIQEELLLKHDISKYKKEIIWRKVPQAQQVSAKCNISESKTNYQNEVTSSYPEEVFVPMNDIKDESSQSQETNVWDNQYSINVNPSDYSILEIIEKQKDLENQIGNNFNITDTLSQTMHLENNAIDNEVNDDDDGDHIVHATDSEESSLTDYDEETAESKTSTVEQSKQQNKEVKPKNSRKHKEHKMPSDKRKKTKCKKTEKFVCDVCSKALSSKKILKRHKETLHSTNSQPHHELTEAERLAKSCKICSKYFKNRHHLKEHINSVHEKQKPFKCSYCPSTFGSNNTRKVHELIHTGEFPFVCEWCQKGFRRAYQLKVHIETHTASPDLLCPICKRCQKTKEELSNHLKIHDEQRSQCPWCGKLFTRHSHLKDHQNAVHLKLRPFKCEFCEMSFADRKTRRSHEKCHTEDRPIVCNVCKRGFTMQLYYKKHLKRCHSTEYNTTVKKSSYFDVELK